MSSTNFACNTISIVDDVRVFDQWHDGCHLWTRTCYEELRDTKGVIRIRKSRKNRQHNGQTKKNQRTNNDLQNITHKTHDRVTWTPLSSEGALSAPVGSCSTSGTFRSSLVTIPVISHEWGKEREMFTTSGTYPWSFANHPAAPEFTPGF